MVKHTLQGFIQIFVVVGSEIDIAEQLRRQNEKAFFFNQSLTGFLGFGIEPTAAAEWGYDLNRSVSDVTAGIWWTAVFPGIAIVLIVLGITLVGESLNDLADPRLRARKSAGEVVGSIEDTSVDPNEKPTARNEVIAELDANVDPPATVTDHDPTIVASEWTGEGKPEGKE